MSTTTKRDRSEVNKHERELARQSGETLSTFLSGEESLRLTLTRADGESLEATIPEGAVSLLADALKEIGKGQEVRIYSLDAEVTPNEAARILLVSRPHLVKMLEAGQLPYRKVGSHYRIRLDDLEAYRDRERQARRKVLDELAAESERLGLYE